MAIVKKVYAWEKFQAQRFFNSGKLNKKDTESIQSNEVTSQIFSELYATLYSDTPPIDPQDVDPNFSWVKDIFDSLEETQDFQDLMKTTKWKPYLAGSAASRYYDQFAQAMQELSEQMKDSEEKKQKIKGLESQLQQMQNGNGSGEGEGEGEQGEDKSEGQGSSGESEESIEQQIKNLKDSLENAEKAKEELIENMKNKTSQEKKDAQSKDKLLNSITWGSESGDLIAKLDDKKILQYLEKIQKNETLRKVFNFAGGLQQAISGMPKMGKVDHLEEICGVDQGDDLEALFPEEYAKLAIPGLKLLFGLGLAAKTLCQYTSKGKMPRKSGPMVICVDTSGSMDGTPAMFASGVVLVALKLAKKQRREALVIFYDSYVKKSFYFSSKSSDFEKMLKVCTYHSGGGTDWEPPLRAAQNIISSKKYSTSELQSMLAVNEQEARFINEHRKALKNSSIIFITDGSCYLGEEFVKDYKEISKTNKVDTISVGIGCGDSEMKKLKEFSNSVINIRNLDLNDVSVERVMELGKVFNA